MSLSRILRPLCPQEYSTTPHVPGAKPGTGYCVHSVSKSKALHHTCQGQNQQVKID
ncbi:hypothetical protein J6590_095369, partial [Homalodisca vitripennis]